MREYGRPPTVEEAIELAQRGEYPMPRPDQRAGLSADELVGLRRILAMLNNPSSSGEHVYAASQAIEAFPRLLALAEQAAALKAERDSQQRLAIRFMQALHLRHEEDFLGHMKPNQSVMDCALCRRVAGRAALLEAP
jgi:hypothetical protein